MSESKTPLSVNNNIAIWHANLVQPVPTMLALRQRLSADELARAKRFHFDRDRNHYIVARGLLRRLLSHYLNLLPDQLRFTYTDYGKPDLVAAQNPADLRFNLSHSGEMVLYGVTYGRNIGIDIEQLRTLDDFEGIATSFFSPHEKAVLRTVPDAQKALAFFNCWTRKEAYIKAQGQGLSLPLDSFDVTLRPGEAAQLLEVRGARDDEASYWTMQALETVTGYVAAVIVEGGIGTENVQSRPLCYN